MDASTLATRASQTLSDNSPNILTGFSIAGVLGTAYLTARATFTAAEKIREHREGVHEYNEGDKREQLKEEILLVWRDYIPAAAMAASTIAAIFMVNRIGMRRSAALAAALSLSNQVYNEYRAKVIEKIGQNKEELFRKEVAQARVNRGPLREIVLKENEDVIYDTASGRTVAGSIEDVRQAVNDINAEILRGAGYVSLSTFWEKIGLEATAMGEEVGWNFDNMLEIDYTSCLYKDKPCYRLEYRTWPVRQYFQVRG